jgi:hypothetical protein
MNIRKHFTDRNKIIVGSLALICILTSTLLFYFFSPEYKCKKIVDKFLTEINKPDIDFDIALNQCDTNYLIDLIGQEKILKEFPYKLSANTVDDIIEVSVDGSDLSSNGFSYERHVKFYLKKSNGLYRIFDSKGFSIINNSLVSNDKTDVQRIREIERINAGLVVLHSDYYIDDYDVARAVVYVTNASGLDIPYAKVHVKFQKKTEGYVKDQYDFIANDMWMNGETRKVELPVYDCYGCNSPEYKISY